MNVASFRLSGGFGLALLAAWPSQVLGLVTLGAPVESTASVAVLMLPLALSGACVWLRAGQRHPMVFRQKRLVFGLFALVVLSLVLSSRFHPLPGPMSPPTPVDSYYYCDELLTENNKCVWEKQPGGDYRCSRHAHDLP